MLRAVFPAMERHPPSRSTELMDRPDCDPERLRDALRTLSRANRIFGLGRLVLRPARRTLAGRRGRPLRVLDVGAGGGDIGLDLAEALAREGRTFRLVLADLHPQTLRFARQRAAARLPSGPRCGVSLVRLTAPALPFGDDSFDLAYSSTMLHHLERDEAVRFLEEMGRVAGGRWIVSDLRRSRLAHLAVRLLAATLWRRHPFPRRDGPVSVRRAFTPGETRRLLRDAGLPSATVERRWPLRVQLQGPEVA